LVHLFRYLQGSEGKSFSLPTACSAAAEQVNSRTFQDQTHFTVLPFLENSNKKILVLSRRHRNPDFVFITF